MAVTVLIVEDEEKIGRFLELELIHEGYEVMKATNGREGLELAESGKADLVVLDVMLPELNGFEVLRRLRKKSDIPVIRLTARDEVMDKVAGLDGGADDYMTKPFAIEELLARIRLVLKKRGITARKGNQILNHLMGVDVRYMDTDSYEDIYAEMDRIAEELGRKVYKIPCGGSNALGTLGYIDCMKEVADAGIHFDHLVCACGSGGTCSTGKQLDLHLRSHRNG